MNAEIQKGNLILFYIMIKIKIGGDTSRYMTKIYRYINFDKKSVLLFERHLCSIKNLTSTF